MKLLKNYFYFFKLSLISLVLSITVLNLSLQFYDTKKALIITLLVVFIVNFIKLKNYYKFKNNYLFFIYSIFTRIISRVVEYYLFLFILDHLGSHNLSWIITISFTHFLKFFFIEIYNNLRFKT